MQQTNHGGRADSVYNPTFQIGFRGVVQTLDFRDIVTRFLVAVVRGRDLQVRDLRLKFWRAGNAGPPVVSEFKSD
ncbi:MAG: hypothetical protein C5B58_04075 [Acidobacteria bacterium]|nr:MAG: hypothetical protein C5B58_04075 [Acidobacteriota bacterium]